MSQKDGEICSMGLFSTLLSVQISLVILKLTSVIHWSWWGVLLPCEIPLVFFLIYALALGINEIFSEF